MDDQTPNDPPDPLMSEEERAAFHEHTVKLAAVIRGWKGNQELGVPQQEMIKVSDKLSRKTGKRRWCAKDRELWDQLLDACQGMEEESLRGKGFSKKSTGRLIRREWATWDSASRRFVTVKKRPSQDSAVPVVVVHREADFRIHDDVLYHLWDHPLLADDIAATQRKDPCSVFKGTLERAKFIEEEHQLDDWEYVTLAADQDSPDRAAARCLVAALDVTIALEPESSRDMEDLTWLTEAKRGMRLWGLLNAAVELGKNLQLYETFRASRIEEAIRRMHEAIPGRAASPEGKATEQVIKSFLRKTGGNPTPLKLLEWLGGERSKTSDAEPLEVEHPLWDDRLKGVSWDRFQNLVKSARRRLESDGSSSD